MSRIGQKPVYVPNGIEINVSGNKIAAKSPKDEMTVSFNSLVTVSVEADKEKNQKSVRVTRKGNSRDHKMFQGLYRSLINNMVTGLSNGFVKELDIIGVGYRAQASGSNLNLQIGYTHPVELTIPKGVVVETPQPTQIIVKGYDKQVVGQFAANVRKVRPPEPYKGKGIRYRGEVVRKKIGKAAVGGEM